MRRPRSFCGAGPFRWILIALAATAILGTPGAPPTASGQTAFRLIVTSDPSGAGVYGDSGLIGTTPLDTTLPVAANARVRALRLKIVGGESGNWFVPVLFDSIGLPTGTITRHYDLPLAARVASEPQGADVLLGDSLLGTTPLFAVVPRTVALLTLRKDGYRSREMMLDPGTPNYHVQLDPVDPAGGPKAVYLVADGGKSATTMFIAAGTAVAAGATAAYYKERADRAYAEYNITGDEGTLDRMRKNDLVSGIALAVAEISLGYLLIELLSR